MEGFEPPCQFPDLSAFEADPFASLGSSPKTPTPGLEPGHPLKDYSRFSKPLPYQLGLCRQLRRRQDLNLHALSDCLFSGQVLHQLSDCGKRCLRDSNLFILTDGLRFPTGHLANSVKTACSTPDRI